MSLRIAGTNLLELPIVGFVDNALSLQVTTREEKPPHFLSGHRRVAVVYGLKRSALARRTSSPHAEVMLRLLTKLKPKRRWMQVSLRTSFIIVTLMCIVLSLWIVPIERKRRAVAAIEALDGTVSYMDQSTTSEPFAKTSLRRWFPAVYFDEIIGVYLAATRITDAELAQLKCLTNLRQLDLDGTQVTDAGLVHLTGLTCLQELYLNDIQVTDVGLAHLQGLTSLQGLGLVSTQVTDAGLVHLQRLTSLKRLNLFNTQVTDAGVAKIQQALPNCQIFRP